jgi:hypothetical protein
VADNNLILYGRTFSFKSGKEIPADAAENRGAFINLTLETFALPEGTTVQAFSTDGGEKWTAGSVTEAQIVKMLNRGMELWLCTKDYNRNAKKPQGSGNEHNIIAFAKINKRPAAPRLAVNYAICADPTGKTAGDWVLAEKGGSTAVRENIQVGAASGKRVDDRGFGQFFPDTGIPVLEAKRTQYFIRFAPKAENDGSFTPASRTRRINAAGVGRAPRYRERNGVIKVRANTYVSLNGGAARLSPKADIPFTAGTAELWMAATARRPASAKQTITITG